MCDPVPVNLAQAMKQIVPAVQDLKRRSMHQRGGETTMPASLIALREAARTLGTTLEEPFLQLAFLALPVIPHLKITDHGMVDVDRFEVMP